MVIGNIIFGCTKLFPIGYWSYRWTKVRTSLCKMVDIFDTLGPNGLCCSGLVRCVDRNTRNDGRSRWFWYLLLYNKLFIFINWLFFPGMQRQVKKSIFHKAYWILYTIATVYSFIITICYWTVVHNPGNFSL